MTVDSFSKRWWQHLRAEMGLFAAIATALAFMRFGESWLGELSSDLQGAFLFAWIFGVMMWGSFGVVRHAEALAAKLGEPYGTLILTLSVITIEVALISAVMLTGSENPTLGRDMMFSVLMIVLNGMVGLSLLLGGFRHVEQSFNLQGANAFLAVLTPLAVLSLILPNFTQSTPDPSFTVPQSEFLVVVTLGLYGVFLAMQTVRHREYFTAPERASWSGEEPPDHEREGAAIHSLPFHVAMLFGYMIPIVLLSKKLAVIIDFGIAEVGAPAAFGGLVVAVLVLAPELITALRAALANQLQRSINISLGSALATIGLTVPAVLVIGIVTKNEVVLGLSPVETLMLCLTLFVSFINLSGGRSNVMQGVIHLILFAAYIVLLFD
ncbi:MAG: calcium:proton antiporter [Polyangiales bacterium]